MAGRPSKYESNVKPRFEEIREWLRHGATDKEIAKNLGVNPNVFCKYKNEFSELNELIKNGRLEAIQEIKAALFNRAIGFNYQESKLIEDSDGNWKKETYTKYSAPDPTSAMILLKHWDKANGWTNDPQQLDLKKKELALKEKQLESEEW